MRRLLRAALLALAACAFLVQAKPLRVEQVAPGVYLHVGQHKDVEDGYDGDIANIGFIVGNDAVAVIDTGGSYAVGVALKEALRAITQLPVRYLINTHVHPDHVFGNAAFIDATSAEQRPHIIAHARLPPALAARREGYLRTLQKQLGDAAKGSVLIGPDRTVQDRLTLDLGGRKLTLTAWPAAHTDNDLTVFDAASGTLWTGDLLFIERTPALDGDIHGWLAATDTLQTMAAAIVIPGHGPLTRAKHPALARQHDYLSALLADVRAGVKRGAGMTATMATAAAAERGRWQLFDAVNPRNVNYLYPRLEWE